MKPVSIAAASALIFTSAIAVTRAETGTATGAIVVSPDLSLHDAAVALGHDYDDLYSKKDWANMAALYAADGELVSPGGKIVHGRSELEAYYRSRFASGATGHKIEIIETHGIGDVGYSLSNFSVSVPTKGQSSGEHREHGHIAAVYAHDASGWHFAFVQPSTSPEGNE